VAIVGHIDSGKSTLLGMICELMKVIDEKILRKIEKEAKLNKKESFKYAYLMDEFEQERKRGITMEVGQKVLHTKSKIITFLDTPGHKDYVPKMICGSA